MQTQLHVQPRVLPHHLSDPSRSLVFDKAKVPPSAAYSAPSLPSVMHAFLDDQVPRSEPRNHTLFTSPQQCSISASKQSRPTPLLLPSHPRALSLSHPDPRFRLETRSPPHVSPSPSPPHIRPAPLFPPPHSAPHHQSHFASSATPNMDGYPIANPGDRYVRGTDKYPHLDQRRMSEPAMYGNAAASGYPSHAANLSNARHHQLQHQYSYVPPQSYGPHSPPLRRSSDTRSIGGSPWKEDHHLPLHPYDPIEPEEPLSPLNSTFSGGESPAMPAMMFGSLHEDYGPSPPGTGTSASSAPPAMLPQGHTDNEPSSASNGKQYAFVSLPGNVVKKRPRRRYDEIERLYQCSWPNCTKSYGTLNHLNAHITMQKHGTKRSPNEFKELRKQWRKAKKEEADARALEAVRHGSHQIQHPSHHHTSPHTVSTSHYPTQNIYAHHPTRSAQPIGPLDDLRDSSSHQHDVYSRRSQRYAPFVSPHPQHSGIAYPHHQTPNAHTSNIPMNRLPANSTLLTPLPGYESSSMSAPDVIAYDLYRGDGHPRTGLGNPVSHGSRGPPRSSHVNVGTGHNRDCP